MKESLDFIYKEQKEISTLGGVAALLGWDQMTYMPPMGAEERSDQTAMISRITHERIISDKLWNSIENLSAVATFEKLDEKDKIVVGRLKKDLEKARKVPSDFVEKMAKITTIAYPAWQKAREKNEFSVFSPHLEKIVELEKEYCDLMKVPGPKYNSLLDDYEEGMTVDRLKVEFEFLKGHLVETLQRIKSTEIYSKQENFDKKFSVKMQRDICDIIIDKIGLPKNRIRLDISSHPFTTSMGYDDVRFTTNFDHENPLFSLFSTVHESGHALYELNMPKDQYKDTIISDAPSLGLHESQSRFWENMIARSKPFWNYFYPIFKEFSPTQFKDIELDAWYRYVNQVKPSLIRVDADELTYCLHVILRFEIENALIEDKIKVSELPDLWNEKMDEMLGVKPANDKEGCLQDMHWSGGDFGYFPTYAIGTIYSAQLFKKLAEDDPRVNEKIEKGEFDSILTWLNENVHKYGRLMDADDIIKKCCGEGLNSKVYVNYLKEKYYKLYGL